jgi:hypothetical protein
VQGGGHSILSPVYGLGVDRVVSDLRYLKRTPTNYDSADTKVEFKVVTPDGEYRVANECQNEDLFWALRGGGGSTWGVVLETSQKVEPKLQLQVWASHSFVQLLTMYSSRLENSAVINFNQTKTNAFPWLKIVTQTALKWAKEGWGGHIGVSLDVSSSAPYSHTLIRLTI